MRWLKAFWRFLQSFYERVSLLLDGLLDPPLAAFKRVLSAILAQLDRLLRFVLRVWARLWQRAPRAPSDRRRTPALTILPLAAGVGTVAAWYGLPLGQWLDLSTSRFVAAVLGTSVLLGLVLRWTCRQEPLGRVARCLVAAEPRTGLIWFERGALIASVLGTWALLAEPHLVPAGVLLGVGFLVVSMSPYEERPASDELPDPGVLVTTPGDADDLVAHTFSWPHDWQGSNQHLELVVLVDAETYEQVKSLNPGRPPGGDVPDFTPWVIHGRTEEVVRAARGLRDLARTRDFTRFEEIVATLGFVQSILYASDDDTTGQREYWRYPVETIHDETGDCEDTAILALSILERLGHEVVPVVAPGHAALAVEAPVGLPGHAIRHEGRDYYYCETTNLGFTVGELPSDVEPDELTVCPLRKDESPTR